MDNEENNYSLDLNLINLQECDLCGKYLSLIYDPDYNYLEVAKIDFNGYIYCKKCKDEYK